jgi:hypothetical protein
MASLPGGLADEKSSCWSRLESMRKMGTSSDIRAAVIDDLTFDPAVGASDIRVAEMKLTGVRHVRNDIQIRDREQA